MTSSIPFPMQRALRALAAGFVPETAEATSAEWAELEARIGAALAARPGAMRRQLALFVRVLDTAARLRYRISLARLDPVRIRALLEWFAASPVLRLRRGIWGLRTLVQLGWYTQPSVMAGLGYRATPAGWDAR
jgi:hypothetical protein